MDYELLARQLIRALRGGRSQVAVSRRLGYRSNVLYFWEAGRRWPSAHETMRMAVRLGMDVQGSVTRFFRVEPDWLARVDLTTRKGMARVLAAHRGNTRFHEIAARVDKSRHSVSRWFSGQVDVRLPDFLRVLDVVSLRAVDFVAVLVDPADVPCMTERWHRIQARRVAAAEEPLIVAVLRVLELSAYRQLDGHVEGFVARRLGLSLEEELRCIELLLSAGQLEWEGGRLVAGPPLTVDTRRRSVKTGGSKEFWAQRGLEHLKAAGEGVFAYNVFGVSEADAMRLRDLQIAYFHELRAIVAASEPTERVYVTNLQLFPLDDPNGSP